jgi:hypothetical protein
MKLNWFGGQDLRSAQHNGEYFSNVTPCRLVEAPTFRKIAVPSSSPHIEPNAPRRLLCNQRNSITSQKTWVNEKIKKKVKVPVYVMKAYRRGAEVQLQFFFTSVLGGNEWLNSRSDRSSPGKEPGYPLNRELGRSHRGSGLFREQKNL